MPPAEVLSPELLRDWPLPALGAEGDKYERGRVHVVGGAVSTPGAVLLAALAALRAGAGRLTITTVEQTAVALGVAVPEALVRGRPATRGSLAECTVDEEFDAWVVGPGVTEPGNLVRSVLESCGDAGVVVDAVALIDLPADLPARTVLTPNAGELRILAGRDGDDQDLARRMSQDRGVVVATRGWICAPDGRCWHNGSGSIVLATSGSGDVLAGVVGGLLARGADPAQAACWGQYLHAAAGERLVTRLGKVGALARELLDEVPKVMAALSA